MMNIGQDNKELIGKRLETRECTLDFSVVMKFIGKHVGNQVLMVQIPLTGRSFVIKKVFMEKMFVVISAIQTQMFGPVFGAMVAMLHTDLMMDADPKML